MLKDRSVSRIIIESTNQNLSPPNFINKTHSINSHKKIEQQTQHSHKLRAVHPNLEHHAINRKQQENVNVANEVKTGEEETETRQ